jgi:hypothetical protein
MLFVHRASVKPILVSPLKAVDYLCFIYPAYPPPDYSFHPSGEPSQATPDTPPILYTEQTKKTKSEGLTL